MKQRLYKEKRVIWQSKTKILLMLIISVLFTASGLYLYLSETKPDFLVTTIFFFGCTLVVFIILLNTKILLVSPGSNLAHEIEEHWHFEDAFKSLKFHEKHFTISGSLYLWDNILSIFGYKVDLMTIDEICLDIFMVDGTLLKITESTGGWYEFMDELNNKLSIPNEWYNVVAKPAFATNLTLIYDKIGRTQEACFPAYYGN